MGRVEKLQFEGLEGEYDTILVDCFTPTREYERVAATPSVIVLGPKGTGKSAIFRKLLSSDGPGIKFDLSPSDFFWRTAGSYSDETGVSRFSAKHAWEFYLLVGLIVGLLDRVPNLTLPPKFYQDIDAVGLPSEGFRHGDPVTTRDRSEALVLTYLQSPKPKMAPAIGALKRAGEACLQSAGSTTIFIDRLDTFWDDSKLSRRVSEGVLAAWKELPEQVPGLAIKLSLRTDSYRKLRYAEHDKIEARIVRLKWTRDTLTSLLSRRVSFCLQGASIDDPEVLSRVFPEYVTGVRGFAGTQDTYSFIFRNIQERPRDLLQFCRIAKGETAADEDLLSARAVVKAAPEYSEQKRITLEKEFSVELPILPEVFARLSGGRDRITYSTLEAKLAPIAPKGGFPGLVAKLVEIGVLGYSIKGEEQFYQDDPAFLTLSASRATTFVVHRCLRSSLKIKEQRQRIDIAEITRLHLRLGTVRDQVTGLSVTKQGEPIFKATRRTEMILMKPVVVRDESSFGKWVVNMCELVHESAGGKSTRLPEVKSTEAVVIAELNRIRSDFTHDLDHGKAKDIAEKQKELGVIYRKYLGRFTPSDEQDWMEIQRGIYIALIGYLERVKEVLDTPGMVPLGLPEERPADVRDMAPKPLTSPPPAEDHSPGP